MTEGICEQVSNLENMTARELREKYLEVFGEATRSHHKVFLRWRIAWRIQEQAEGGLTERAKRRAAEIANDADLRLLHPRVKNASGYGAATERSRLAGDRDRRLPIPGTLLVRDFQGRRIMAKVLDHGFEYDGKMFKSLSAIAREVSGTRWNGVFVFRHLWEGGGIMRQKHPSSQPSALNPQPSSVRCAIYTRKSTEENLDQSFNSLDAQREASESFIASRKSLNWVCQPHRYDDGGYTGGNLERPALQRLLRDIENRALDCVVVHRVDRLSRSLLDFARIMEILDRNGVSFVSVTQPFDSTDSMGRLTLNVMLSFAQLEREIIAERTRDKMSAARRKGKWLGGPPVLGYDVDSQERRLNINEDEAVKVRAIFDLYLQHRCVIPVVQELDRRGWGSKAWTTKKGIARPSRPFIRNAVFRMLGNVIYAGKVLHRGKVYPGEHEATIDQATWDLVQQTLRKNGAASAQAARNRYGALLRGILYCTACETAMVHAVTAKKTKRYRYYVCLKAQQRGWSACPTKSLNSQKIEDAVLAHVRGMARNAMVLHETVAKLQEQGERRKRELDAESRILERDLKRVRAKVRDVVDDISEAGDRATADNVEVLGDLQGQAKDIEERLENVRRETAVLDHGAVNESDLKRALDSFDPIWDELTPGERTRIIRLLVERVGFDGRDGTVVVDYHSEGIRELCHGDGNVGTQGEAEQAEEPEFQEVNA